MSSPTVPATRPTNGVPVWLRLPTIPYGTETNQLRFPLAMNLNPTTLAAVVGDLVDSLASSRHSEMRSP